jgi:putative membrane protein
MQLDETERRSISERAARLEARTGVQVVAAVIGKCDAYPEIPWKAFALGAGMAALAAVMLEWLRPAWPSQHGAVLYTLIVMGAGAACALLAVFVPAFARLFLDAAVRDAEVRQYAESFFLSRELFRTGARNAILILVGVFERKVVILPDAGLRARLTEAELGQVIAQMAPLLAAGRCAPALRDGLDALEALLAAKGFAGGAGADEIAQEVFEEKGE